MDFLMFCLIFCALTYAVYSPLEFLAYTSRLGCGLVVDVVKLVGSSLYANATPCLYGLLLWFALDNRQMSVEIATYTCIARLIGYMFMTSYYSVLDLLVTFAIAMSVYSLIKPSFSEEELFDDVFSRLCYRRWMALFPRQGAGGLAPVTRGGRNGRFFEKVAGIWRSFRSEKPPIEGKE